MSKRRSEVPDMDYRSLSGLGSCSPGDMAWWSRVAGKPVCPGGRRSPGWFGRWPGVLPCAGAEECAKGPAQPAFVLVGCPAAFDGEDAVDVG